MGAVKKVSIVIPVYNERKSFDKLMAKVLGVKIPLKKEIIVVEGGSTDGTRDIIKKYAKNPLVKLKFIDYYCGKGHKVRMGLKMATGDVIIIQDADLEYDPAEYPALLKPFIKDGAKFVLGSRHMGEQTWQIRKFSKTPWWRPAWVYNMGDRVTVWYMNLIYGTSMSDPHTMFKIFHKDCMKKVRFVSDRFDLDMEILAKIIRQGYRPVEVPVSYRGRSHAEGKKLHAIKDGIRAVWAITKFRFVKLK